MGFMLLGFVAGVSRQDPLIGYAAAMFYTIAYVLTTVASFGIVLLLSRNGFEADQLDDLKGLKMRVTGSKLEQAAFKILPANPTPIAWAEVFTALKDGAVDGVHVSAPSVLDGGMGPVVGQLVDTMVQLRYLKKEEIPAIPTRKTPLRHAVYAPLAQAPVPPDVVLVRGNARQLMLVAEAAEAAGVAGSAPTMGRPTCAVIPQAENSGHVSSSFGCIGNRVYTGAGDDEAYVAIPGAALARVVEALEVVVRANAELEKFHRARC
jgi:hypothetical protein